MAFPDNNLAFRGMQMQEQSKLPKTHIVPAAHGFAFAVKKGEHFRVVDLYGEQVVGQ